MPRPLQTTFRNMPPSEDLERAIEEHVERLGRFGDRIVGCRVVVEARRGGDRQEDRFHVRIGLALPGGGIVVGREPAAHDAREDVGSAVRDAFSTVERRLEDYEGRHLGRARPHELPPRGRTKSWIARRMPLRRDT